MAWQAVGVIIGLIGLFTQIEVIALFGGTICLFLDLSELITGRLKPYWPLLLYFLGFLYFQSFMGILYGAVARNFIHLAACPIKIISGDINVSFRNKRKKSNAFKGISYKIDKDIGKKKLKDIRK